jgi:hypothetical protein
VIALIAAQKHYGFTFGSTPHTLAQVSEALFHVRRIGLDFFRWDHGLAGPTPVIVLRSLMLSSILVFCAVVMVAGPCFYALSPRQVPNLKPYLRRLRAALANYRVSSQVASPSKTKPGFAIGVLFNPVSPEPTLPAEEMPPTR